MQLQEILSLRFKKENGMEYKLCIRRQQRLRLRTCRMPGFFSPPLLLDFTRRTLGLVFLACAMLFLAVGCGGGSGGSSPQDGTEPSSLALLDPSSRIRSGGRVEIEVTAALDNPAPPGGTDVMISLVITLEGGKTIERNRNITIAAGQTAGTVTFTITDRDTIDDITDNAESITINATSTNPTLRARPIIEYVSRRPPTRSNPIELEFRPRNLRSPDPPDGRDYRDEEFTAHWGLGAISADEAYSRGYFGQEVTIAVADTGADITHPDLAADGKIRAPRHLRNRNERVGEPQEGGGHGTYVALLAAGVIDNPGGPFEITFDDGPLKKPTKNFHGVAPQASVMPISMEDRTNPVEAIRYAVENEAQVLNFSLSTFASYSGKYADREGVWLTESLLVFRPTLSLDLGPHTDRLTQDFSEAAEVLEDQDIVLVWGAGNDGWNSDSRNPIFMCGKNSIDEEECPLGELSVTQEEFMENFLWIYDQDNPDRTVSFKDMWGMDCGKDNCAEYNSPGGWKEAPSFEPGLLGKWLVAVATDEGGRISSFSNGCGAARNWCLAAPGEGLTVSLDEPRGLQGTSFAAPMVSGALAVLKSRFPDMPMEVIQAILLVSADPVGIREDNREEPDPVYGWGRLNLGNAIVQQDIVRLPYSVPEALGATRGISPGNYRPTLIPAFVRADVDGQNGGLRQGQCVSPYEVIRRYRNRN